MEVAVHTPLDILPHSHNGQVVHQRGSDGYINATAMCRALGKEWSNYRKNEATEAFIEALERSLRIRRDLLVQTISGGPNEQRGTWIHPQIAINLATWLSPDFAVQVSEWVVSWMMGAAQRATVYPDFGALNEDEKRLYLRDQVAASNKKLAEAARGSGVVTSDDFAIFQSHGYRGMYDGRSVPQIRAVKQLPKTAQILDHMGSAELAANLFRITQTEKKLINEQIDNKYAANHAHYEVGKKVRQAMIEISGTPPERLPVAPDVKKLQKQIAKPQDVSATQFVTDVDTSDELLDVTPENRRIDLKADLWKYALLIMARQKDGFASTSMLISELPDYIAIPDASLQSLAGRKDSKFSQLVRNLKSHKTTRTSFIYLGYAQDVPGGFRITSKGIEFVKDYFALK
jgi:hypothetical protein